MATITLPRADQPTSFIESRRLRPDSLTMSRVQLRIADLLLVAVAATWVSSARAAAPANDFLNHPLVADATLDQLPEPAQGQVAGLNTFTAAPVPDLDHIAPAGSAPETHGATLSPKLFHNGKQYHGEGYVFGSTVQEQEDRRNGPTPGINLIMPLQ